MAQQQVYNANGFSRLFALMINDSLQQLAQAYELGNISKQEYRQRRTKLLNSLFDEPTLALNLENTLDIDETQPIPDNLYKNNKTRYKILYAAISCALIIAVIVFWDLSNLSPTNKLAHTAIIHNEALNLINNFMQQNKWDNNTLSKISRHWRALPQKERQIAIASDTFQQLTETTRKKIHEQSQQQRGLTIDTRLHKSQLLRFAENLGINATL